jgi:imidazolonepropionase-like amidohydrolase
VRAMMRAGMSAVDVVRSATVTAARWLELDSVGAIAVGRDADLVALHGSELDSPEALSSVAGVWRRGRTVPARGSSRRRLGAR